MQKEDEIEALTMRIWLDSQMLFELLEGEKIENKELKSAIETLEAICLKK